MNVVRFRAGIGKQWLKVIIITDSDEQYISPSTTEPFETFAGAARREMMEYLNSISHDPHDVLAMQRGVNNAMDEWSRSRAGEFFVR